MFINLIFINKLFFQVIKSLLGKLKALLAVNMKLTILFTQPPSYTIHHPRRSKNTKDEKASKNKLS